MMRSFKNLIILLASLLTSFAVQAATAVANLDKAELYVLNGGALANGQYLAGLEIRLSPGVKTYWRMPGDSGLPPIFDFSASRNIAKVEIKWPQPSRLKDADGTILGFEDRVIFPLVVTPQNPAAPVTLAVTLDFGLCDTLCLPAKADLARGLTPTGEADAKGRIEEFLARVPNAGSIKGEVKPVILAITPDAKSLIVQIASPTPLKDVILETSGSWYFGMPEITPDGEGRYRALVPIEQKPSVAMLGGLPLTITAIAEGAASETTVTLDASGSIR
jgi:DsbC/DsbD-like thiol-disulfide interchange protein